MLRPTDPSIAVWPALVVAPLLALNHVSAGYALVTPSCAGQTASGLVGLSVASLLLALAMTLLAWRAWRRIVDSPAGTPRVTTSDATHASSRGSFLALLATLVGALSTLVIVALCLPLVFLPPCA